MKPLTLSIKSLATIGFASVATLTPATAQEYCFPRGLIVESLEKDYNETLFSIGSFELNGEISATEIWVNQETGTFTILQTFPSGISCMVNFGENWTNIPQPLTANDAGFVPHQMQGLQTIIPAPL